MLLQQPGISNLLLRLWPIRICWLPVANWLVIRAKRRRLYLLLLSLTCVLMIVEIYRSQVWESQKRLRHSPPALLIESKKTACLQYDDALMTSSARSGSVAIVGWRSTRTLDFLSAFLEKNADSVLVASPEMLQFERSADVTAKLSHVFQDKRGWTFLRADTQCNVEILGSLFRQRGVQSVHVLYEELDFLSMQSASETGAILQCYVSLLEVIAREKHVTLYLHLKHQRSTPVLSYDSHQESWVLEGHAHHPSSYDWRDLWFQPNCDPAFDYTYLHDVFLKTLDIYTTTYSNLYDIPLHVVISQT